jgi:hypothetical protein
MVAVDLDDVRAWLSGIAAAQWKPEESRPCGRSSPTGYIARDKPGDASDHPRDNGRHG